MEFYEVIRRRRSIRGYKSTSIPGESLSRIFEAVRLAPTACNLQPFRFLVLESVEARKQACECYTQTWLTEAPVVVVALGSRQQAWKRFDGTSAHTIDVSIALEHFVLAAAAEGLGTCWVCAFDQEHLARKLELGEEWEVVALTPLGFPAATAGEQTRKPVEEIFEGR